MKGKTHIAGGMVCAVTLINLAQIRGINLTNVESAVLSVSSVIGSLLPDIDNVNSKISNTNIFTKVISVFANLFLGHRELTHYPETFVVLCLLLLSGCFVSGNISPVVIGFLIGYGSHIVLDLLNPMGIRSAITKKRYSIARIKTGGACENLIFGLLVFIFFIII